MGRPFPNEGGGWVPPPLQEKYLFPCFLASAFGSAVVEDPSEKNLKVPQRQVLSYGAKKWNQKDLSSLTSAT
jgi:hypothetical protein